MQSTDETERDTNDKKEATTFWREIPRWVRGLILGNILYFVIVGVCLLLIGFDNLYIDDSILIACGVSYLVCCALGALLVQQFGEETGFILLFLLMFLIGIVAFFYLVATSSLFRFNINIP